MKTRRITIIAAIAALVFVGTSCGNKTQKTSQEEVTTVEQSANSGALEIDNLLADAESLDRGRSLYTYMQAWRS